jgi:WD40 repeat protein
MQLTYNNKCLFSIYDRGIVIKYDIKEKRNEVFHVFEDKPNLRAIAFSPDDKYIFIGTQCGKLYQLTADTPEKIIVKWPDMHEGANCCKKECGLPLTKLAVTPMNEHLIYSILNMDYLKHIKKMPLQTDGPTTELYDKVWTREDGWETMIMSPDGKSLFLGGKNLLYQVSVESGKIIKTHDVNRYTKKSRVLVGNLGITPNGKYLVTSLNSFPIQNNQKKPMPLFYGASPELALWSIRDFEFAILYGDLGNGMVLAIS